MSPRSKSSQKYQEDLEKYRDHQKKMCERAEKEAQEREQ